jgi:hypothetical protein
MNRGQSPVVLRMKHKLYRPSPQHRMSIVILLTSISLSGCSALIKETEDPLKSTGRVTTTGVHQLFDENSFEKVDLPNLLDPENRRGEEKIGSAAPVLNSSNLSAQNNNITHSPLEKAFNAFYKYPIQEQRRNRIQDRLLAASEQRCNLFKNYLKRVETYQSTTFGILTTVLAGAGAIATGTVNSRAFAGLAGITSGMGAELKEGFFSNLASQVITPGIDLRREKILKEINDKRNSNIRQYTVEAAIRDVALYHGACNINVGLEEAGVATKTFSNPGLDSINQTLFKLRESNSLMTEVHTPLSLSDYQKQGRNLQLTSTTGTISPVSFYADESPLDFLNSVISNLEALFYDLSGVASTQLKKNVAANIEPEKSMNATIHTLLGMNTKDETVAPGTLVTLKNGTIQKLLKIQGLFSEASAQLSTLIMELNSTVDKSKRAIAQSEIDKKQAEYQMMLKVPVTLFYDSISVQLEKVGDDIRLNNASGVNEAMTQAASGVIGASGVSALK